MTLKHIRNNTSAENEEIVKNVALEQNGVLKVTKKNLFNYQAEENYETFDLKDIKLRIQKVSQNELNELALSEEEDDILLRETNIFLVNFGDEGDDEYKEFIWTIDGNGENGRFEQVGTTKLELDTKVDKEEGKGLFSDEEKAKLEGIAFGANYYVHPATHPASMITDLETVATSGSYNDLKDKPTNISTFNNDAGYLVEDDISGKANSADLARVATTGSYNDLEDKPTDISTFNNDAGYLTENDINGQINSGDLARVATTGSYNDLNDKPTDISTFNNDIGYLVEDDISGKANSADLATVATTGSYNSLKDKPTDISTFNNDIGYLVEDDISGKANSADLATVATTGSYNSLKDKPTDISTFNNDAGYLIEDLKGSFDELQQLIYGTDPGDKIILDKDYKNTGNESRIDIDRDITIVGNGHIIDGDKKNNIFSISSDNITFRLISLILKNGKNNTSSGGAISSIKTNSPIFINNCTFIKNEANEHGGAIYSKYSPLTISDCNFYENVASTFNGGAIYCLKTSSISNSYFINNVAHSPGNDIYSTENGLIIYNCHNPSGLYNCVNKELKYEEFEITYDDNGEEETEIITFLVLDNS